MSRDDVQEAEVVEAILLCPLCESELASGVLSCIYCGTNSVNPATNPFAAPTPEVPLNINGGTVLSTTLVSVILTVGLISVLAAVGISSPGLGICLALLTIPPWVRTALVMRRRSKAGLETSKTANVSMLLGSAMVTWLILFVSLISCCLTFCIACLGAIAIQPSDEGVVLILVGTLGVTFILVLLIFSPWIRSRWLTDIRKE